jgi:hypothetical protein
VIVFALSNACGRKLTAINTLTFAYNALLKHNGKDQVLHLTRVGADGTDGRNHTYFVYTPFVIQGDALVEGKPQTWIQYRFRPNHWSVKNLTVKEMARAWAAEKSGISVKLHD